MKRQKVRLLEQVVPAYDNTKTTIQGNMVQGVLSGQNYISTPPTVYIDTVALTGQVPLGTSVKTTNGRLFVPVAEAAGVARLLLFNFNNSNGVYSYVGQIAFALPDTAATTHTYRMLRIDDTGTTNWRIFVGTLGSVALNGGLFKIHKVGLSDFVTTPATIPFATGNDQKAVYFLQDPSALGALNTLTALGGGWAKFAANEVAFVSGPITGFRAAYFDTSATPTWSSDAVTGTEATNIINHTGHSYVNGDVLVFTSLTGGAGLVVGTVYFVVSAVAGVSYQLAATSGGAAINFTTDITAANIGRAFGITGALWKASKSTGVITGLTGTFLLTDCFKYVEAIAQGPHAGSDVIVFASTTAIWMGLESELTSGATSWPSAQSVSIQGNIDDIALTPVYGQWSTFLNKFIFMSNTSVFFSKDFLGNSRVHRFGIVDTKYNEQPVTPGVVEFGGAAVSSMQIDQGWVTITCSTVGQRGVLLFDLRSDIDFDYTYFVTRVLSLPGQVIKSIIPLMQERLKNLNLKLFYRLSGFGSITGGWLDVANLKEVNLGITQDVQFKGGFKIAEEHTNAPYLFDLELGTEGSDETAEFWVYDDEASNSDSPAHTAFRLQTAHPGGVKTYEFTAMDDAGSILAQARTDTDFAQFSKSSDTGTSWAAMTGANDFSNVAKTTMIRFNWSSPPVVSPTDRVRVFLKEI